MKFKVGFKAFNIVQDLTAFNTTLKCCQHSETVVQRCSQKFHKIRRKHLCQSLIFNKVAGFRPETLLKKRPWHRCFPVNFVEFQRSPFLQNTFGGCFLTLKRTTKFPKISKKISGSAYYIRIFAVATKNVSKRFALYKDKHQNKVDIVLVLCFLSLIAFLLQL